MRLIECYVKAFGGLKELHIEFGEGLNCFIGDNGVGKSTLAAFIKAMLYGLGESRKSSLEENDRKHYIPWDGRAAGGSLTFAVGRKEYRVERSFGKRPSEDSFALYDARLGKRCEDMGECIGEELFGMSAEVFERTAFFSERNLVPEADSSAIAATSDGESGAVAAELSAGALKGALDVLDAQRKTYVKKGGGGAVQDAKNEIYRIDAELERLGRVSARAKESEARIGELTKKRGELSERSLSLSVRQDKLRERMAAKRYDERLSEIRRDISELNRKKDRLFEFFGGHIPTGEQLDELSYKRKLAEELKLQDELERREGGEYEALAAEFAGRCDDDEASRVKRALSVLDRCRDERAQRTRAVFSKRIPTHRELDELISMHTSGSRGAVGLLLTVFGLLLLCGGIFAGMTVSVIMYAMCAVGALIMAAGIIMSVATSARARTKRDAATAELLASVGGAHELSSAGLSALVELKGLIDEAEKLEAEAKDAESIIGAFTAKFSTRVEDSVEAARELIGRFERMRQLRARERGYGEISSAIRGEQLLLDVADSLAIYDIRSDDPLREVKDRLWEYERVTAELIMKSRELETISALRGLDAETGVGEDTEESLARERGELSAELSGLDGELAILTREYDTDMKELSGREALLIERGRLEDKLGRFERELRTVQSAASYLSRAADALNEKYLEGALASFKSYVEMLGGGEGEPVMDTSFSTSVIRGAATHPTESLSRGSRDAYRLAARLAILDSLYSREIPFILLDDPFVSFDDGRISDALELLLRLGEKRQTIYFTCSRSRAAKGARALS